MTTLELILIAFLIVILVLFAGFLILFYYLLNELGGILNSIVKLFK